MPRVPKPRMSKPYTASIGVSSFTVNCPVCCRPFADKNGSLMWCSDEINIDEPPELHCEKCGRDIELPNYVYA